MLLTSGFLLAADEDAGHATLYVNGRAEGDAYLGAPITDTEAPVTIGAVDNDGRLMQQFLGAIDELAIRGDGLGPEEAPSTAVFSARTHAPTC